MRKKRLDGKVAIVTGAGAHEERELGTGRATSVCLAREGARVLVADLDEANAQRTVDEIQREGGEAMVFQADSTLASDNEAMVAACVERYGAVHVLVNNVGLSGLGNVADLDEDTLRRSLDLNLNSAVFASKYAIPAMHESGGGSIINVSSIDGLSAGMFHNTPYALAKGALHMLTKTTAAYHGRQGIRANCIAPGPIHASFTTNLTAKTRALRSRSVPLGTEGTAWDIAWGAVFLASDEARWISGVIMPIDGGLLASAPLTAYGYIENVDFSVD